MKILTHMLLIYVPRKLSPLLNLRKSDFRFSADAFENGTHVREKLLTYKFLSIKRMDTRNSI